MNRAQVMGERNRLLSPRQIDEVSRYTFDLLEKVGVWVQSGEALSILGSAGCNVRDAKRVKIPRRLVLEAIEAAPKEIEVYNRSGQPVMTLKTDSW